MKTLLASAALLTLSLTACMPNTSSSGSKLTSFSGTVSAANEVPAVTSSVSGNVVLILNEDDKTAQVQGVVTNLSGAPTMLHIHAPALKGANAPVLKPLIAIVAGTNMYTIGGSFSLTDAEIADLKAKKFYFNIHTAANPGGEGRAQLE